MVLTVKNVRMPEMSLPIEQKTSFTGQAVIKKNPKIVCYYVKPASCTLRLCKLFHEVLLHCNQGMSEGVYQLPALRGGYPQM